MENLKFRSNFLEWVRNDMKTFLSLVMPTLYCLDFTVNWFWGDILGQEIPSLHDPYMQYYCTVWFMQALKSAQCYVSLQQHYNYSIKVIFVTQMILRFFVTSQSHNECRKICFQFFLFIVSCEILRSCHKQKKNVNQLNYRD